MTMFFPELKIKDELLDYDETVYKSESDNSTELLKTENTLKKDETSCSNSEDTENIKPSTLESHPDSIGLMKILSKCEEKMKTDVIKEMQLLEEPCQHDDHSPNEVINFEEATPSSPISSPTSEKSDIIGEYSNSFNDVSDNTRTDVSDNTRTEVSDSKSRHSSASSSTSSTSKTFTSKTSTSKPPLPLDTIILPAKYQHLVEILQENKHLTEQNKLLEVNCILTKMIELIHQYNCMCFTCRNVGCGSKFSNGSNRDRHEKQSCKIRVAKPDNLSTSDPFERKSKRMRKEKPPSEQSVEESVEDPPPHDNEQERRSKRVRHPRLIFSPDMFEYFTKRSLNKVVGETAKSADESEAMEEEKPPAEENPQEEEKPLESLQEESVQIEVPEPEAQSGQCGFGLRLRKKSEPKIGLDGVKAEYSVVENEAEPKTGLEAEYNVVEKEESISKEEETVVKKEVDDEEDSSDSDTISPARTHDQNANQQPGRRIRENKHWCWNTVKKKKCQRVKLVMNQDQFNYKKIHPYHVYKPALETSYHNPFPWTDSDTNSRNVFDMMISDITNLTRLIPVIKDRRAYKTGSIRLRKDLKNRLKVDSSFVKDRSVEVPKAIRKKIKVFSPDLRKNRPVGTSPHLASPQNRRTKSFGTTSKVQPSNLNYKILDHASPLLCQSSYVKIQKNRVEKQTVDDVFAGPVDDVFAGPVSDVFAGPVSDVPRSLYKKVITIPRNAVTVESSSLPTTAASLPTTATLSSKHDSPDPPVSSKSATPPTPIHCTYFRTDAGKTVIRIMPGQPRRTVGYTVNVDSVDKSDTTKNSSPADKADVVKTIPVVPKKPAAKNPYDYEPEPRPDHPDSLDYTHPTLSPHESISDTDDIRIRRVFPNNQGTGLNLLKSMRVTNKILTVEKPTKSNNFEFNKSESDGMCDFFSDTLQSESGTVAFKKLDPAYHCSGTSTIFTNKALSGAAFGPCFSICKKHLLASGHARNNEIVLKSNKLTSFVYDMMHKHQSTTFDKKTQTSDDSKLLSEILEVDLFDITKERDALRAEYVINTAQVKNLKSSNYTYSQRIKDFDEQLSIEKELREFLKEENDKKLMSNNKLEEEIIKLKSKIPSHDELKELKRTLSAHKKRIEELENQNKVLTEEVETTKQENINLNLSKLEKLDSDDSVIERLKRENRYLTKQGSIKDKKIKTLQVSVTSISEALREQTKTVCDLSRKSSVDISPEEESNHKIYVGFESLVKITCKVLGSLQKQNEKKIEEPEAMRKLCQMVSGDENLFSLFRKIFSKEGGDEEEEDKESVEKRVLFLINLMSYFYSGADETPSSSGLKTLL